MGSSRHELLVVALGAVPVLGIESQAGQRAEGLLFVGLRREERQRFLVLGAGVGRLAAILVQVREREDGRGVAGF